MNVVYVEICNDVINESTVVNLPQSYPELFTRFLVTKYYLLAINFDLHRNCIANLYIQNYIYRLIMSVCFPHTLLSI